MLTGLRLPPIMPEKSHTNRKRKAIVYADETAVETNARKSSRKGKGFPAEKLTMSLQREEERVTEMSHYYGTIQRSLQKIEKLSGWKEEVLQEKVDLEAKINRLTLQLQSVQLHYKGLQQKAVQFYTSL